MYAPATVVALIVVAPFTNPKAKNKSAKLTRKAKKKEQSISSKQHEKKNFTTTVIGESARSNEKEVE